MYVHGHSYSYLYQTPSPLLTFISGVIANDSVVGEVHRLALIRARLKRELGVLDVKPRQGASQRTNSIRLPRLEELQGHTHESHPE